MAKREAPVQTNFSRMLRLYRRMNDIPILTFATEIGVAPQTVMRFEKGHDVDGSTFMKILTWAMQRPTNPDEREVVE